MGSTQELCLKWNSYETSLLMSVCDMWNSGAMTDVTLSAEGRSISAHQVVLSSCSRYFKEVLQVTLLFFYTTFYFLSKFLACILSLNFVSCWLQSVTAAQHPIIILPFASYQDLLAVIQFIYKGEINITQAELSGLLEVAETLGVKGLAKLNQVKTSGLLEKAYQQNREHGKEELPHIKVEPDVWNSTSCDRDEEADEIMELSEGCNGDLIVNEGKSSSVIPKF